MIVKRYRVYYLLQWTERFVGKEYPRLMWWNSTVKATSKREAKRKVRNSNRIIIYAKEVQYGR